MNIQLKISSSANLALYLNLFVTVCQGFKMLVLCCGGLINYTLN